MQHLYISNRLQNEVNSPCAIVADHPPVRTSRQLSPTVFSAGFAISHNCYLFTFELSWHTRLRQRARWRI
nr:MAG TPA: hypothetical protein [Caudoviricetes sp.]